MRLSSGSGFIVTHSGVIVTNAHVVTTASTVTGRSQLRVQLHDGDAYEAVVRDVDRKADIATIKVTPQVRASTLSSGSFTSSRDHSNCLRPFSQIEVMFPKFPDIFYVLDPYTKKHSTLLHKNPHPDTFMCQVLTVFC